MGNIPKNQDKIYFDKLARTQKKETVKSLIYASYRARNVEENKRKSAIAKLLEAYYDILRDEVASTGTGSGTYSGKDKQFSSQYTIGRELDIYKNSSYELTDFAKMVATDEITITEYFDCFYLNYVKPIINENVHILYRILKYMVDTRKNEINRDEISIALRVKCEGEHLNSLVSFLSDTSYLDLVENKLVLNNKYNLLDLIVKCDTTYEGREGYERSLKDFDINTNNDENYDKYIESSLDRKNKTNNELTATDISDKDLENLFRKWLSSKLNIYSKEGARKKYNGYSSYLVKLFSFLNNQGYIGDDFLHRTSEDFYDGVLNKCRSIQVLADYDYNECGHKAGSSALKYYSYYINLVKVHGYDKLKKMVEEEENETEVNDMLNPLEIKRQTRDKNDKNPLNQILYGAPGTGKTFSTIEYALSIIEGKEVEEYELEERADVVSRYQTFVQQKRITFTTFHQNTSYEEFIYGLRVDPESSELKPKYCAGIFKTISDTALIDKENKYVIIIDEINRANISKVFGELITLIEEDKRWGEINQTSVILPDGCYFVIPNNLYIIGTMNSADKSISLIDAALRRRFTFIEKKPNYDLINNESAKKVIRIINDKLVKANDNTDCLIGHSYFIGVDKEGIKKVLNLKIIPLLYEYFYDNRSKVYTLLSEVNKECDLNYEIDDANCTGRYSFK